MMNYFRLFAIFTVLTSAVFAQDLASKDVAYGALIHGQIVAQNPVIPDSEAAPILRSVFEQLAATPSARSGPVAVQSLTYLRSSTINAYATAGGRVYVTDSLMRTIGGNPGILAFVLGHELAHNVYQHGLQKYLRVLQKQQQIANLRYRIARGDKTANWEMIGYVAAEKITSAKLDRDAENLADRLGLVIAAEAGYHPAFAILAARTLREQVGEQTKFGAFFSDHPRWTTREERAEQNYPEALARFAGQWPSPESSPGGQPPILLSVSQPSISKSRFGREIVATFSARNINGTSAVVKLFANGSGGSHIVATRVLMSDEQGAISASLTDQDLKALGANATVNVAVESDGVTSYVGLAKQVK